MLVNEIFDSVQGEGVLTGTLATFVRFAGCNLACAWCDTKYAWNGVTKPMSPEEIGEQVDRGHAVLTGGEPLLQPTEEFIALVRKLHQRSMHVTVETNGTLKPDGVLMASVDLWSVSPKFGSSKASLSLPWDTLDYFADATATKVQWKFVLDGPEDIEQMYKLFWKRVFQRKATKSIVLQPVARTPEDAGDAYKRLLELVSGDSRLNHDWRIRVLPQVHTLIWKGERGI